MLSVLFTLLPKKAVCIAECALLYENTGGVPFMLFAAEGVIPRRASLMTERPGGSAP